MDAPLAGQVGQDVPDELARRLAGAAVPGQDEARLTVVRHLHALVREMRPSQGDLRSAIGFLTDVGHHADARRQKWVLLADVIGVSTLVEDLNAMRPPEATPNTVAGPFYRADAPDVPNGANLSRDRRGEPLAVTGRVTDCAGAPLAGALVEVWQANGEGLYENQEPDRQPEFNLRGRLTTDAEGRFWYASVKPKGYRLPEDGPVGRLANRLGYRLERPAHLHFRVTAPGYETLTTHIFDRDDPAIGLDALFGVKPALLAAFLPEKTAGGAPLWSVDVALVLAAGHVLPHTPNAGATE